jgi:hypothetical protein
LGLEGSWSRPTARLMEVAAGIEPAYGALQALA